MHQSPGSAVATEAHFYWNDWSNFIGGDEVDECGLIEYSNCGSLVMKTEQNGYLKNTCLSMDQLNTPYEALSTEQIKQKFSLLALDSFAPIKSTDNSQFGISNGALLKGAVLFPLAGYISHPQLAQHYYMRYSWYNL